jgi:hypothetical protein
VAAVGLALVAVLAGVVQPANAAPPSKVRDVVRALACTGVVGDLNVNVILAASQLAGTEARAQVIRDGEFIATGYGTSQWTDSTFAADVELTDEDGTVSGALQVNGRYQALDDDSQLVSKFKDGNIRVHESHTSRTLQISDVSAHLDGQPLQGLECQGSEEEGYLFYTSPTSYVFRSVGLTYENCAFEGASDVYLEAPLDRMLVFVYAEEPRPYSLSVGDIDVTSGYWTGSMKLAAEEGPIGQTDASISLVPAGKTFRVGGPTHDGFDRTVVTPYDFQFQADGLGGPISVTCEVFELQRSMRIANPNG